jgi:hypothetical protein
LGKLIECFKIKTGLNAEEQIQIRRREVGAGDSSECTYFYCIESHSGREGSNYSEGERSKRTSGEI